MPKPSTIFPAQFEVFSDDPVVNTLQSFIKSLAHFQDKGFTLRHLKVVMAVRLAMQVSKQKPIPIVQIELYARLPYDAFKTELFDLVERRYLHKVVPTFGDETYKMGSTGGSSLRALFKSLDPAYTDKQKDPA